MKTFPAVVTGIFIVLALGTVFIFATFSAGTATSIGTVVIWGSAPQEVFDQVLGALRTNNNDYSAVTYRVVPDSQLRAQLVEAIASGKAPDLVLLPEQYLVSESTKLQPISYSAMSRRDFQDSFIQAGESFLAPSGILGIPFMADPLVMYWNRTLFSNAGLATPPRYWDEISDMAQKLTTVGTNGTITQSGVSLGSWSNVSHAKEIFLSLLYQLGNPVVSLNDKGQFQSVFLQSNGAPTTPASSVLRFYSDFSDPSKTSYSWNSAQTNSHDAFVGGKLAVYFGYASELASLRAANPNLNFDVAPLPSARGQINGAYANVLALSIPRGAGNPTGALTVAQALTSPASQTVVVGVVNLPSVRRDVTSSDPSNPYASIFENAALSSFAFLDPDPSATDSIFQRMLENVTSGRMQVSEATQSANDELQALLGVQ